MVSSSHVICWLLCSDPEHRTKQAQCTFEVPYNSFTVALQNHQYFASNHGSITRFQKAAERIPGREAVIEVTGSLKAIGGWLAKANEALLWNKNKASTDAVIQKSKERAMLHCTESPGSRKPVFTSSLF